MAKKIYENRLMDLYRKDSNSAKFIKNYTLYINELMGNLDFAAISEVVTCFRQARERESTIFFIGNGGSASTASHFSQDLAEVGRKTDGKHFKTLSLTNDVSFMTAMANDYGYETIFTGQMQNLFKKDDVLVAISASGKSPSIVNAVNMANDLGGITVGLAGFDGGNLLKICDHTIHVKSNRGEYGPVEDIHVILNHMITTFIMLDDMSG